MKIDFGQEIKSLSGKPFKVKEDDRELSLTLKHVCTEALLSTLEEDKRMKGSVKYDLWKLADKVYNNAENDSIFSVEDVALIKERVGKSTSSAIVGPVYELLEAVKE